MDTYQPIYDAVRSRIGSFYGQDLVDRITQNFDFSFYADQIRNSFQEVARELARPSTIHKPKLVIDGNQWCALYGEDLHDGVAGFGDSPELAMADFDKEWHKKIGYCEHGNKLSAGCDRCLF